MPGRPSLSEPVTLYMPRPESVRLIACSPPSWMVQMVLTHKSVDHSLKLLAFDKGEHRTAEMLARNPRGTIPVLTHGERAVYETFAILEYLEAAFPEPPLMPAGLDAKALALTRFHESANLKSAGMSLFAYLMRTEGGERDMERVRALCAALVVELELWEHHYEDRPIGPGEGVSLADFSVFAYLATAVYLGLELKGRFQALQAFYENMLKMPAIKMTWPATWSQGAPKVLGEIA
jgi:glutathione S-transferase